MRRCGYTGIGPVRLANKEAVRKGYTCCGWHEFVKLGLWGLDAYYDRIVVLDTDLRVLRSLDHLLGVAAA